MSPQPMPPRRPAWNYSTVARLRADPGQDVERFAYCAELGAMFKMTTDPAAVALTDDSINVVGVTGGTPAVWLRQDLATAPGTIGIGNQTITIAGGRYQQLLASTPLTGNAVWTLSSTGIATGTYPEMELVRFGLGAFTIDVGGLVTFPVSARSYARVRWAGLAWTLSDSHALL